MDTIGGHVGRGPDPALLDGTGTNTSNNTNTTVKGKKKKKKADKKVEQLASTPPVFALLDTLFLRTRRT